MDRLMSAEQVDSSLSPRLSKGTVTNLVAVGVLGVGVLVQNPFWSSLLFDMGAFALSGALTNSIAIHMLFERVPGLYGSGVIELRFEAFKTSIEKMILEEFFSAEQLSKWTTPGMGGSRLSEIIKPEILVDQLDYELLYQKLMHVVSSSPLGGMLALVGGVEALDSLKEPAVVKMRETLSEFARSERLRQKIDQMISEGVDTQHLQEQIKSMVRTRLDELTPQMVKQLVQNMIREHLGWLVVWGGVFGALIGAAESLLTFIWL